MQHGMAEIMLLLQDFGLTCVWEAGMLLGCTEGTK